MSLPSRFSVSGLLTITFVACLALASLVVPSLWWPIFGTTLIGALLVRTIFFSPQWRAFGYCFAGSVAGFCFSIYMVSRFQSFVFYWERNIAGPLSNLISGRSGDSFSGFNECLFFWTAVTTSGLVAYAVASSIDGRNEDQSSSSKTTSSSRRL